MTSPDSEYHGSLPWAGREVATVILLFLGMALVLSFRLGAASPTFAAEIRCWKVVSEMTQTGDWLVPRREGRPALNKPPLFYWAGAAISSFAGGASYATLRAPSLIAALAVFLLTYAWGRSIGGPALGVVAAGLLAAMFKFYELGREGTFEMLLALLTNAALLTFDRIYWTGRRSLTPLFFLFVLAAFLTKGPPAFLIVGVPIVLFLAFRRQILRLLKWRLAAWFLVTLALGLLWFAAIIYRVPGAWERFFSEATLPMGVEATTKHTAEHYHHMFYFFSRISLTAAVVSLLFPLLAWRAWQTRFWRDDPRLRFCGWIFVGLMVGFSLFPQKQAHYLLPLFPAIVILTADAALWAADPMSNVHWAWLGIPSVLAGIASIITPVPLVFYLQVLLQVSLGAVLALSLALAGLSAATVWFAAKRRWQAAGTAILLSCLLVFLVRFDSFEIVQRQFATGEFERRADYDPAHWTRMKESYPFVAKVFHRSSRFMKDENEKE